MIVMRGPGHGMRPRRPPKLVSAVFVSVLLAAIPAPARGQDRSEDTIEVHVYLVSEGGVAVKGAVLRVETLGDPPSSRGGSTRAVNADSITLRLVRGGRYRIGVSAPGHRHRTAEVQATRPATLRLVLSVDPYELPPIVAAVEEEEAGARAHSVFQTRFSDESLTYATVAEWLQDIPGAAVRGRGPGSAQVLSVRGSRPEDVLVLLDGAPLNDPLTGRANLAMIPTATLESATLVQGAASQRYGSGASAGVLLLTSRMGEGTGMGGGLRMGSFGEMGFDLQGNASRGSQRLALSFSAGKATNNFSFRNPRVSDALPETRRNADAASVHGAIRAGAGPVYGSLRVDRTERGVPGRAGTSLFSESRAKDRSWTLAAGFAKGSARGSASLGRRDLGYRGTSFDSLSEQSVRELRVAGDLDLPAVPVTAGGRLSREDVRGDGITGSPSRTVVGGRFAAALRAGRFRLDPAVSADFAGGRVLMSPELSATWVSGPGTRVWGRVGQGFRLPSFGDLYFASQHQLRANPDLEAERITFDSELGVAARASHGAVEFKSSATGWARRTENPIVWLASSVALWSPRNLGELRATGLDLQLELASRERTRLGWRVQITGTLQRSRVGYGSNRNALPYEPGAIGRFSLEGWSGTTGVRGDLRFTGSRTTSLAATRSLAGFATMDLSVRHQLDAGSVRVGLFARIENVLDRRYQLIELFPEPGRHFSLRFEAGRATP